MHIFKALGNFSLVIQTKNTDLRKTLCKESRKILAIFENFRKTVGTLRKTVRNLRKRSEICGKSSDKCRTSVIMLCIIFEFFGKIFGNQHILTSVGTVNLPLRPLDVGSYEFYK